MNHKKYWEKIQKDQGWSDEKLKTVLIECVEEFTNPTIKRDLRYMKMGNKILWYLQTRSDYNDSKSSSFDFR